MLFAHAPDRLTDRMWSGAIFWLRPADSCMPLLIGSNSCQPHPGTPNIRCRCSLPGLTGFTNIQLRGDRQESPLSPEYSGASHCQGNHASDASLIAMRLHMNTTKGRIKTIPRPSMTRVPNKAPRIWAGIMTATADQITKSLVANIKNAAKFVMALKSLAWIVASRSPRPSIDIINNANNDPVPGPKKPS